MTQELTEYINEKLYMLRREFKIKLEAKEIANIWASKNEIEVDQKVRVVFNAHL